jgi:hypothetical protein
MTYPSAPTRSILWDQIGMSLDTYWSPGSVNLSNTGTASAVTLPANNYIIYIPIPVRKRTTALKLWVFPQTTGTDNIQLGIYNRAGSKLVATATTAKSTTVDMQVIDITDTKLSPGLYYWALQCAAATATFQGVASTAPHNAGMGIRSEAAGSFGLPTTATWVLDQTLTVTVWGGIITDTIL